jgi:hypothetical protein
MFWIEIPIWHYTISSKYRLVAKGLWFCQLLFGPLVPIHNTCISTIFNIKAKKFAVRIKCSTDNIQVDEYKQDFRAFEHIATLLGVDNDDGKQLVTRLCQCLAFRIIDRSIWRWGRRYSNLDLYELWQHGGLVYKRNVSNTHLINYIISILKVQPPILLYSLRTCYEAWYTTLCITILITSFTACSVQYSS